MKERRWYYLLPAAGILFGIWYIRAASFDVVYSDYIRLVNSYLPDVWNPSKFLTPDVLTRVPVTYLGRIINTVFFHYSLRFDQVMGVLGLGACLAVLLSYCIRRRLPAVWALLLTAVVFSLNKWELLVNGSGWVIFWAFAGFYWHYLVLDRVWAGEAKARDRRTLLWLPSVVILGFAGQYCAVYAAVLFLAYLFRIGADRIRTHRWNREYIGYLAAAAVPFGLYLLSNSFAVEDHAGMQDLSFLAQLADTPGYFVRFMLKSLSSAVVGIDFSESHFSSNLPYMALGGFVMLAYLGALWLQYRFRIWERTVLPLMLVIAGGANHVLILLSRWSFLREDYGMSSRYALQFSAGVIGILLTFAHAWNARGEDEETADEKRTGVVWRREGERLRPDAARRGEDDRKSSDAERRGEEERGSFDAARHGEDDRKSFNAARRGEIERTGRWLRSVCIAGASLLILAGTVMDTRQELEIAPYRRALCMERAEIALDFENRTDDELRENFEYRTSQPQSGQAVRNALEILKGQGWNVFYGK